MENNIIGKLQEITSRITEAYGYSSDTKDYDSTWPPLQVYKSLCCALHSFAMTTNLLYDRLEIGGKNTNVKDTLEVQEWSQVAKRLVNALRDLTRTETTYEESFGTMDECCTVDIVFTNAKDDKCKSCNSWSSTLLVGFVHAAEILFRKGESELGERYALMRAISYVWSWEEREDKIIAIDLIPSLYLKYGKAGESVIYHSLRMLKWLYAYYLNFPSYAEQWGLDEIIQEFQSDLLSGLDEITVEERQLIMEFWKTVINNRPELYNYDFVLSQVVDYLCGLGRQKEGFELVEKGIEFLSSCSEQEKLIQLAKLAKLGFCLKDRNIENMTENIDVLKSSIVDNKTSELAKSLGYDEEGERVWDYKSPIVGNFMGDKATKSVEIDVHQMKTEHQSGKERKLLFLAECKYRKKPAATNEVEFFMHKVKDLLEQKQTECEKYPKKLAPKLGEFWFVSISGFSQEALTKAFDVEGCRMRLIDGKEFNDMLAEHNIHPKIPIGI
jgi:hypothetical protein